MLTQVTQIVEGTFNNITNRKEDLYSERIAICRQCPIKKDDEIFGEMCNNRRWMNPNTGEVSYIPLDGYVKGCGCKIKLKAKLKTEKCPAGK